MKKILKSILLALEYKNQNPTVSITKVSELFNLDRHTLSKYTKQNINLDNLYENQSDKNDKFLYYYEPLELEFIQYYINNPSLSFQQIVEHFNQQVFERRALYHHLQILGYDKTVGASIKYHYDRNKFKVIATEEDAYWLGFITADGCIIENKWLQIGLKAEDKHHLEKFCFYMGLNPEEINEIIKDGFGGAYTRDNPVNIVKICSIEIVKNLQDKGIEPRKSGKEKPYILNDLNLEKAYIRGLLDGDGYIRSTQYGLGIVGSYEICLYVKNFLMRNLKNINDNKISEHGIIYKFALSGKNQSQQILDFIYKDAKIYLDRKYNLYIKRYANNN